MLKTFIVLVYLGVFSAHALEFGPIEQVIRVGDCQEPRALGLSAVLNTVAQSQCPAHDFQFQLDLNVLYPILFGSSGVYEKSNGSVEKTWIWKDAQFLYRRIIETTNAQSPTDTAISKLNSASQITRLFTELGNRHPYESTRVKFALEQNLKTIQCLGPFDKSSPWLKQESSIENNVYSYLGQLSAYYPHTFWSLDSQFIQLHSTQFQPEGITFDLNYTLSQDRPFYLWVVDSCGIAKGQKIQPNWPWQPSFQSILTQDLNQDGHADAIDLRSKDLIDSLKNWQLVQVLNRNTGLSILSTKSWHVLDSNLALIRIPLNQELDFDIQNFLALDLKSKNGKIRHYVSDGVAPIVQSARLMSDTLLVQFSNPILVQPPITIAKEEFTFQPISYSFQNAKELIMVLPKYSDLKPGNYISISTGVMGVGSRLRVLNNKVLVKGQVLSSPIEAKLKLNSLYKRPKELSAKQLSDMEFSMLEPQRNSPDLLWIDVQVPPSPNLNPTWNIDVDIYDVSGQVVTQKKLILHCKDMKLVEPMCDDFMVTPIWMSLPWNMTSEAGSQIPVGAYILQVQILESNSLLFRTRKKFGISSH